jgi:hypothetical protein
VSDCRACTDYRRSVFGPEWVNRITHVVQSEEPHHAIIDSLRHDRDEVATPLLREANQRILDLHDRIQRLEALLKRCSDEWGSKGFYPGDLEDLVLQALGVQCFPTREAAGGKRP